MVSKKIVKNYIFNTLYQLLLIIVPLITTPYISRILHSEGVGAYSYTSSIAAAFVIFAALGIAQYGQREIAYYQDDIKMRSKIFYELCIFRVITTIIVLIPYVIFSLFYEEYKILLLIQIIVVASTMFDISWFFQGLENFRIIVIKNLVCRILSVAAIFIFVKTENDLWLYTLIVSLTTLIGFLMFFFDIKGRLVKVPIKELEIKKHIKGNLEFLIPILATQLYSHLDRIMLGAMTNDTESGYYANAKKIIDMIVALLVSINTVMYPRVANLYKKGETDQIKDYFKSTFSIIIMLLVPIALGLIIISDNFVIWFFGEEYLHVGILLKLSSLLLLFMCIGNFVGVQYLSPTGNQNKMSLIYIICAFINIGLNFLLIYYMKSTGALIASIIAESISCILQVILLLRSKYRFNMIIGTYKYLIAGAVMFGALFPYSYFVPLSGWIKTLTEVGIGFLVYFLTLIILRETIVKTILSKVFHKKKPVDTNNEGSN